MADRWPEVIITGTMSLGSTGQHYCLGVQSYLFLSEAKHIGCFTNNKYDQLGLDWCNDHYVVVERFVGTSLQN